MTLSQLFNIANIYAVSIWTLMIFFPNWSITKKIMRPFLLFIPLIFLYIYYLVVTFDSESVAILASPQLQNIARFFSKEGAAGTGWVHFLVVDLFLGRWIYWQGQEKNILTTHSLLFCLFFGPVGLLSHIITAYFFDKKDDSEEAKTDAAAS